MKHEEHQSRAVSARTFFMFHVFLFHVSSHDPRPRHNPHRPADHDVREADAAGWARLREKVGALPPRESVIVMSGPLPSHAPQDFYTWCVPRANDAEVKSFIDATGEPLKRALAAHPTFVKTNRVELAKT